MASASQPAQPQSVENAALLNLPLGLVGNPDQGSGSSVLTPRLPSRQSRQPELWVDFANLPVDISEALAQKCQKAVTGSSLRWFPEGDTIYIEFEVKPRDLSVRGASRTIVCNSQGALEEALQEIDPDETLVLIIIPSFLSEDDDDQPPKPKCTLRAMMALCNHFKVLPTFTSPLGGQPSLWAHAMEVEKEVEHDGSTNVLGYKAAFPWFHHITKREDEMMHTGMFGTATYLSLSADGIPTLTIFSNIYESMVEPARAKWDESLHVCSINTRGALLPHFTMIGLCLHKLMHSVGSMELLLVVHTNLRFGIHMKTNTADLMTTITKSRKRLNELILFRFAIDGLSRLIKGLDEEVDNLIGVEHPGISEHLKGKGSSHQLSNQAALLERQLGKWKRTLLRQAETCRGRINDLIEVHRANEGLLLSFMAQRDSASQANSTARMASLAKATENSGRQIHDMTRRMEIDAKTMRSLAEVTAVFLPLTAIATFFSMDFLSITSDSGPVPVMANLRHIWVYAIALLVTCGFVFGFWWYSNRSRVIEQEPQAIADIDAVEKGMELQASIEEAKRKEIGRQKLEEARAEWDDWKARKARGEPTPDTAVLCAKIYAARKAVETGEDFDELMSEILGTE